MGKIIAFVVVGTLVVIAFAGKDWLDKVEDGKSDKPNVRAVKVCTFVSYGEECADDLVELPQSTGDIYATFKAENITNSPISVKWEYVQGRNRSIISESLDNITKDGVIQLKLEKDLAKGWLLGDYQLTVSLEGFNSESKPFAVVSD